MKKIAITTALAALALSALPFSASASDDARGRELVNSLGCKGCHQLEGKGGTMGPALDGVGKRMSDDLIHKKLVDPKSVNPNSMMPSYKHLPEKDLEALVDYLEDLK